MSFVALLYIVVLYDGENKGTVCSGMEEFTKYSMEEANQKNYIHYIR